MVVLVSGGSLVAARRPGPSYQFPPATPRRAYPGCTRGLERVHPPREALRQAVGVYAVCACQDLRQRQPAGRERRPTLVTGHGLEIGRLVAGARLRDELEDDLMARVALVPEAVFDRAERRDDL